MAWLAHLDAKAAHWSRPTRRLYAFCKWNLVAMGAVMLVGLGFQNISDKQPGLGLAFLTYLAYAAFSHIPTAREYLARRRNRL